MTDTVSVRSDRIDQISLGEPERAAVRPDDCRDLARALRGFGQIYAVPGYPVSHLLEELVAAGIPFVWSANEKTAVEAAVGAAICGVASAVIIKHNGLGLATDSLANAVVHGVAAPLVVIVGDDVDARSSTSAVDSRELGVAAGMLTISPHLSGDVVRMVELAASASASTGAPSLLRITGRIHDHCSRDRDDGPGTAAALPRGRHDTAHAHVLTKASRIARAIGLRDEGLRDLHAAGLDTLECVEGHRTLLVAVGDVEAPAGRHCLARVRGDAPDRRILAAVAHHGDVLVAEEGAAVIERQLVATRGRRSGELPATGRITPEMIRSALRGEAVETPRMRERPQDGPTGDAALFEAIARHRAGGVFVATDVGSSVALSYPPFAGADSALALGSSAAVAAGAARAGRRAIAVLGDFALLHSGLSALMEAAAAGLPVVTVILENGIQQKTGGQPLPPARLDLLLRGGAVGRVVEWSDDGWSADALHARLAAELAAGEPVVVRYRRLA